MLLNEYRLQPWTREAQEFLVEQMNEFFFGSGGELPKEYRRANPLKHFPCTGHTESGMQRRFRWGKTHIGVEAPATSPRKMLQRASCTLEQYENPSVRASARRIQ